MTRTIWLVVLMMLPVLFLMKHLYQWAAFTTPEQTWNAFQAGILITQEQELCINLKHFMLSPVSAWVQAILVLRLHGVVVTLLNKWTIASDKDPAAGTFLSFDRWRTRFENLSGPSLLLYVIADDGFRDRLRQVAGCDLVLVGLRACSFWWRRAMPYWRLAS